VDNFSTGYDEYARLRQLNEGRDPYGDCQLVALAIARVVPGAEIVRGFVEFHDGDRTLHYWVKAGERDLDPLAENFTRTVSGRRVERVVTPEEILNEWRAFLSEFPYEAPASPCRLRWRLGISDFLGKRGDY
jgi:hypothetical protein